jgi:hypothetical protein
MAHCPEHLREQFYRWIEASRPDRASVDIEGRTRPVPELLIRLSRCTDIMPGAICEHLDMPDGRWYAMSFGARNSARVTSHRAT